MNHKKVYSTPHTKCSKSRLREDFMSNFMESLNKSEDVQSGEVGTKERDTEPTNDTNWGNIW